MSKTSAVPGTVIPPSTATPIQRLDKAGELDMERVQLITRVVVGAANEGGGYLYNHFRRHQALLTDLVAMDPDADLDAATRAELIRYLAVGAAIRAQRSTLQLAYDGAGFSFRAVRKSFSILDRLTDNPLGRPLRWPAEQVAERISREINQSVIVGHQELTEGSMLVREATLDIVDEFIAYISDNPELADLVSEQIGQQSIGMATAVTETSRELTGKADRTVEDTIRGWLGLPARRDMPRSPFAGKPASIHHPGVDAAKAADTK